MNIWRYEPLKSVSRKKDKRKERVFRRATSCLSRGKQGGVFMKRGAREKKPGGAASEKKGGGGAKRKNKNRRSGRIRLTREKKKKRDKRMVERSGRSGFRFATTV